LEETKLLNRWTKIGHNERDGYFEGRETSFSRQSALIPLEALENSGIHQGEFEQLFLAMDPEAPGEDRDYLHWEWFENPY
jgi:hypothetical protein